MVALPSPGRRDSPPDCEAGASPHIPGVVSSDLLRLHPALRKAQRPRPAYGSPPETRVGTCDRPRGWPLRDRREDLVKSTPRTKQDNLQSRLPDPAQFVPEVAEIAAGMFKATQNGSIPQTTINRVQLRAGQIVGSTYHTVRQTGDRGQSSTTRGQHAHVA
jgi:hypothetical protein